MIDVGPILYKSSLEVIELDRTAKLLDCWGPACSAERLKSDAWAYPESRLSSTGATTDEMMNSYTPLTSQRGIIADRSI